MTPPTGYRPLILPAGPSFLNMLTGVAAGGPGSWRLAMRRVSGPQPTATHGRCATCPSATRTRSVVDIATGRDGQLVVAAPRAGRMGVSEDGSVDVAALPGVAQPATSTWRKARSSPPTGALSLSRRQAPSPGRGAACGHPATGSPGCLARRCPGLPMSAPLTVIRAGNAILVSGPSGTWALPGGAVSEAAIP